MAQKTYLFKALNIETIIRNPKTVGLFGCRYSLNPKPYSFMRILEGLGMPGPENAAKPEGSMCSNRVPLRVL